MIQLLPCREMSDLFIIDLRGQGAEWRIGVDAKPTWKEAELVDAATTLFYKLSPGSRNLLLELRTPDDAPLDPDATLEAQGITHASILLVRLVPKEDRTAGAFVGSIGGACKVSRWRYWRHTWASGACDTRSGVGPHGEAGCRYVNARAFASHSVYLHSHAGLINGLVHGLTNIFMTPLRRGPPRGGSPGVSGTVAPAAPSCENEPLLSRLDAAATKKNE